MKQYFLWAFILLCCVAKAYAEPFVIQDIRVKGLQRIPIERVYGQLQVEPGDRVDQKRLTQVVKALFATGDYKDIEIGRDGDVLVVSVAERPSIASISIEGNKSIGEDDLLDGLDRAGLSKGEVFRRATLEGIRGELQRQYIAQGRYGAKVKTKVVPRPRNRVALEIDIVEGKVASIYSINVVGNKVFPDEELLDQFELKKKRFWSFFKGDDKYSRERLSGDLETLRSYYLDRGYIRFGIESTQVSITPDKKKVHITVNVDEGDKYSINEVHLAGEFVIPEEHLKPLIVLRQGQTFSQRLITFTNDILSRRLGNEGYTFADINGVPQINDEDKTVDVTFFVDPGRRNYVRRILFAGNNKTSDEVLRREMRQFEGAPASTSLIDLGSTRLQRLGFFATVDSDLRKVPGTDDQIDVIYDVEEQPSGSVGANIGYSQASGLTFGANVSQNNFFGTGNRVSFAINNSRVTDSYNFSFFDPYFTDDGVSRGISAFFSETDFSETNISNYALNRFGGAVTFGYPVNEVERLTFGFSYENSDVETGAFVAAEIRDFLRDEGEEFDSYVASISWRRSTLNRGLLPDRGASQRVNFELAIPGSSATFYKLNYDAERYVGLTKSLTLRGRFSGGFGDGYGDSDRLPFFKHYFAGGFGSVRGYESRSLGPRSPASNFVDAGTVDPDPDPIGGNLLVEGALELIFPTPFAADNRNIRTAFFVDGGNVFLTEGDSEFDFDVSELRYAYGVGLSWYTVIGPLSFVLARPVKDQQGDETETFQFSLGTAF